MGYWGDAERYGVSRMASEWSKNLKWLGGNSEWVKEHCKYTTKALILFVEKEVYELSANL